MTDLTTTYMGLALANPWCPPHRPSRAAWTTCAGWRTPGPGRWCCTPCSRSRSTRRAVSWTVLVSGASYAEALTYFPQPADFVLTPERYLDHVRRAKAAVGIRSSGASTGSPAGLLGALRPGDRAGRGGRPGAERLPRPHRPPDGQRRGRAGVRRPAARGAPAGAHPVAVKLSPSSPTWRCWPTGWTTPGRTPWCCSTASTSRTSTWSHWRWCPVRPSAGRTPCACPCAGSPSSTAGWPRTSRPPAHPLRADALKALVGASVTMLASELLVNGIDRLTAIGATSWPGWRSTSTSRWAQLRGSMSQRAVAFLGLRAGALHPPGGQPHPGDHRGRDRRPLAGRQCSAVAGGLTQAGGAPRRAIRGQRAAGVAGQLRPHPPCPAPPAPCVLRAPSLQEAPITLSRLPGRPPWAGHPGRGGARWPAPSPTAARRR